MYRMIYDPGMGPYPPVVALTVPTQFGVSIPCGAVLTRKTTVLVPGLMELNCKCMEGFLINGWNFILPGWRCLDEP